MSVNGDALRAVHATRAVLPSTRRYDRPDAPTAGLAISFLRAGFDDVVNTLTSWRTDLDQTVDVASISLSTTVAAIEPFQAPWTCDQATASHNCGCWVRQAHRR